MTSSFCVILYKVFLFLCQRCCLGGELDRLCKFLISSHVDGAFCDWITSKWHSNGSGTCDKPQLLINNVHFCMSVCVCVFVCMCVYVCVCVIFCMHDYMCACICMCVCVVC